MHRQSWPAFDPKLASATEVTIVVQVDGRMRDRITASAGTSEADLQKAALASPKVKAALAGARPSKVIVVPDRIVSIVTK